MTGPAPSAGGRWRLLTEASSDGAWNMAVDEALLLAQDATLERSAPERELDPPPAPILRLYGFSPRALSLGRAQAPPETSGRRYLVSEQIDLVRRPTGGRAVLHDEERTYSVIGSLGDTGFPRGVVATYERLSRALLQAVVDLGVAAERVEAAAGRSPTAACFGESSIHEIQVSGRKLIGSAQLRRHRCFLQHGSLLIRASAAPLARALGENVEDRFTDLERSLGRAPDTREIDAAIVRSFERTLGARFSAGGLTDDERLRATRLYCWKYLSGNWTERGRLGEREARLGPVPADLSDSGH